MRAQVILAIGVFVVSCGSSPHTGVGSDAGSDLSADVELDGNGDLPPDAPADLGSDQPIGASDARDAPPDMSGLDQRRDEGFDGPGDVASDGGPPVVDLTGICTESGWCWQRARPQGNDLAAVWVAADDDVWAVGYGGTIIHWDGRTWTSRAVPGVHDSFYTIWGTGTEVWVGGAGVTRHWMANAWKQDQGAAVGAQAIHGTSATDVWLVTDVPGVASHYDGRGWAEVRLPSQASACRSVWAAAAKDVWFACDQLLHYDGVNFTPYTGSGDSLTGTGPSDVWGLGATAGSVTHWNGQRWMTMTTASADTLVAVWARSATEVFAVADYGALQRYDGARWTQIAPAGRFAHTFVMGGAGGTVWTGGGQGYIARSSGGAFAPMTEVTAAIATVRAVWAYGPDDAWAATDDGILRKDGAAWTAVPGTAGQRYDDIWGSGARDVWFMKSGGALQRWDGSKLAAMSGPAVQADSVGITGSAADNVWLINPVAFYRWDGSQWTSVPNPASSSAPVIDAWTSGPRDLWAVDQGGSVWRWNGTTFTPTVLMNNTVLRSIWGTATDDVWVAGDGHVLTHWDGQTWKFQGPARPSGAAVNFYSLSGTAKTNLWALGAGGFTFRWDGTAWTAYPAYTFGNYASIAATPDRGAFFAGWGFGILHHDP